MTSSIVVVVCCTAAACSLVPEACCWVDASISDADELRFPVARRVCAATSFNPVTIWLRRSPISPSSSPPEVFARWRRQNGFRAGNDREIVHIIGIALRVYRELGADRHADRFADAEEHGGTDGCRL